MNRFKTSWMIFAIGIGAGFFAAQADNLSAAYVAAFGTWIAYTVHVIEVKMNKLLDDRGIYLKPSDLD